MSQGKIIKLFKRIRKGRLGFLTPGVIFNRRVSITRAGWIYLTLIIILLIASLNTANNLLYLIVGVMLSFLVASFILSESTIDSIMIERASPEQVQAHTNFSITYRLTNQKRLLPSIGIMIEDSLEGKPCKVFFPGVRAGSAATRRASTTASRRGRLKMDRLTVSTRHPFGFFFKAKQVNIPTEIVVCPRMEKALVNVKLPPHLPGQMRSSRKGQGDELFGFRDYIRGDNHRLIHWKSSARAGKLLTRELEEQKKRAIIIEFNLSMPRPLKDDPEREDLISRAASLSKYFIERNYQVRIEFHGRGIDFGEGTSHLFRILYYLAVFDDPERPLSGEHLEPVDYASRVAAGTG
jgi:uncharacterized protein (DUF58 family)